MKIDQQREPGGWDVVRMLAIRFAGGFLVLALTAALLSLLW